MAIYSASKAALNVLSASMRLELKDDNIQVMTVHPGLIANDFGKNTHAERDMEDELNSRPPTPTTRTSADAANDIIQALREDAEVCRSSSVLGLTVPL